MDCDGLAKQAMAAAAEGRLLVSPAEYKAVWNEWLDHIQHWCISRQLWWGHRIPAWRVIVNGVTAPETGPHSWVIALDERSALQKAREAVGSQQSPSPAITVQQDEAVLDSWFSSALLPFAVMGWPNQAAADLQMYYRITLLETRRPPLLLGRPHGDDGPSADRKVALPRGAPAPGGEGQVGP